MMGNKTTNSVALIALLATMLVGCVTPINPAPSLGLAEGRPLEYLVNRLGSPQERLQVGREDVYTWYYETITTNHVQTFSGVRSNTVRYHCTIKAGVDGNGIIRRTEYSWRGPTNYWCNGFWSRIARPNQPVTPTPEVATTQAAVDISNDEFFMVGFSFSDGSSGVCEFQSDLMGLRELVPGNAMIRRANRQVEWRYKCVTADGREFANVVYQNDAEAPFERKNGILFLDLVIPVPEDRGV